MIVANTTLLNFASTTSYGSAENTVFSSVLWIQDQSLVESGHLILDTTRGGTRGTAAKVSGVNPVKPIYSYANSNVAIIGSFTQVNSIQNILTISVRDESGNAQVPATFGQVFVSSSQVRAVAVTSGGSGYYTGGNVVIRDSSIVEGSSNVVAWAQTYTTPITVSGNIPALTIGDTLQFQTLVQGNGLWAAASKPAQFLRESLAYDIGLDPRLPKHDTITANLIAGANAEITVSNIALFPSPSEVYANATVTANLLVSNVLIVPVTTVLGITIGARADTDVIPTSSNTIVDRIFTNNNTIRLNPIRSNLTITSGAVLHFTPYDIKGSVRVREEVILYEKAWESNSTLTGLTRSFCDTPSATISGNITAGNLITSLGIRTLTS
jgi:hypothetical protein